MDKHQKPNLSSQITLILKDMRGQELGEKVKVWKEIASCEARITLMKTMITQEVAFADIEEFGQEFTNKIKSEKFKNNKLYKKVSQQAMRCKLVDEQMLRRQVMKTKLKMKKELTVKLKGEKTRPYRRVVNYLNNIAREHKKNLQEKYKSKLEHLKNKYKHEVDDDGPPEDLLDYVDLSVYNKAKFDEKEIQKYEVQIIGDVILSEAEKEILRLHNKFSVLENLKPGGLDADQEASIAKLRMERVKEKEQEGFTVEEKLELDEIDAKARMAFDPKEKVYDSRKKRVTDMKECSRITLPKPLTPEEESRIEVRKRTQKEVYENFRIKNTNKNHEQKSNLKPGEKEGLKSLLKRIEKEEIMILKTDKSGRFVVTTPEKYIEMGTEHTSKDTEINWMKMKEMEKKVTSHSLAWEVIWNSGEDHHHQDRIIRSRNTRSGNQANLSLLYKDHKEGNKTRPVASGNESYNLGLSNGISEFLESVARAKEDPYSVISAEDLLGRVTRYNQNNIKNINNKNEPVPPPENETEDLEIEIEIEVPEQIPTEDLETSSPPPPSGAL